MISTKRLIMILAVAALCVCLLTVAVSASEGVQYYVAGVAELCGSEWMPSDSANAMTEGENGIYTKVYKNVAAGTYGLKVTDGSWRNTWGESHNGSNCGFTVERDGSTVTVIFDSVNEIVNVEVSCPHNCLHDYNCTIVAPTCTERGYTVYTCANCDCSYEDNFTDETGHEAGRDQNCVRCGVCCHIYDEGVKTTATCTEDGYVIQYCIYCSEKKEISIPMTGHDFSDTTICTKCDMPLYYIAGDCELCRSEWDMHDPANVMSKDENGTYTKFFDNVKAGFYQLKVTGGTWDISWGDPEADNVDKNYELMVSENDSTVTVTFDPINGVVNALITAPDGRIFDNEGIPVEQTSVTEETTIPSSINNNLEDNSGDPVPKLGKPVWTILIVLAGCVVLGGTVLIFAKHCNKHT